MNYLAHIYLAGEAPDAQLGALLGDFVKPGDDWSFPSMVRQEIRVHRAVDMFTDSHQAVLSSKALFGPKTRRFSGVILDVLYDHFLASQWEQHCPLGLGEFSQRFYLHLSNTEIPLPSRLAQVAPTLIEEDWLGSYRSISGVERAVDRIADRMSKGAEEIRLGLEVVRSHQAELQSGFMEFFPALMQFAMDERARLMAD